MYFYVILVVWIIGGWALGSRWLIRKAYPPDSQTQQEMHKFVAANCMHPEVEQVEVGDGILVPREVVAKICTTCLERLPADYSSPHSVIMTNEESVPFPYHRIDLSYWTSKGERFATTGEIEAADIRREIERVFREDNARRAKWD